MSDDASESIDENKMDVGNPTSVNRNSTVTDNLGPIFNLLRNSRCRYLLYYLFAVDRDIVECDAAVNAVYKYERAGTKTKDQLSREEIRLVVHHILLPRLGEAGVLEYDNRQGTIRFKEPPELKEWVEHARTKELE